jgi:pyruvate dehydrogenase E2 component (dihydrolipoamide acetyltransferase)
MIEFRLPSLGSDMDEGTLLEWHVAPGQTVKKGDVVALVDTSKAAIDVEIWVDGTVHQLLTSVGQTIAVGTVMALVLAPGEVAPAAGVGPEPTPRPAPAVAPLTAAEAALRAAAPARAEPAVTAAPATRLRVTPAARQRAAELGLALDSLHGSGPDGAITRDDVERAAGRPMPVLDRAQSLRKAMAAAMARSKREIPHYYLAEDVPMRAALDWLRATNAARPVTQRLLPAVLLLKAVALALREVPEMNGLFVDGEFRRSEAVHMGVAITLRGGGLVAPALHDVAGKPLDALMVGLSDLVQRARSGGLRSSELSDATITVTNLGEQGVETVFGVIYPPQVALVGFGRVSDRAWVEGGLVGAMPVLTGSLSADHRVSTGHRGALFLARLRVVLQQPEKL